MNGVSLDLRCGCGQHVTLCRNKKTQKKLHVLVVDDDPSVRELLAEMMIGLGHEVDLLGSGKEALDFVRSYRIYHGYDAFVQLVFTDFRMPGMDGIELTKHIKDYDPRVTVIMVSGDDPDAIRKAALATGASAFVRKPFILSELQATIASFFH